MLSVREVAARCGVSMDAVRRAIRRGDLPASKVFGRVRVDPADLQEYIEGGRVGGGQVRRRASPTRRPTSAGSLSAIERRAA